MEFTLSNVGIIKNSTLRLNGLTVITGSNDSGKSTAGKALYSTIEGLTNLAKKKEKDVRYNFERISREIVRTLNLNIIMNFIDINQVNIDNRNYFLMLAYGMYYNQPDDPNRTDILKYKSTLEMLSKDYILKIMRKQNIEVPQPVKAYLNNFDESKAKALTIFNRLNPFLNDDDLGEYAKFSVVSQFRNEFKGQIYPNASSAKKKESKIILKKNQEIGCEFVIENNSIINNDTKLMNNLFFRDVIFIDNAFVIDELYNNGLFYLPGQQACLFHNEKLKNLLRENKQSSLIEDKINEQNYLEIIEHMSNVIPGDLLEKDGQMFYSFNDNLLRAENLATGSKVFAIIKSLIKKGKIDLDTMLILDEPESHLHPAWQNEFAEIIVLLVQKLGVNVLLTTHSPNFLLALDTMSKEYSMKEKFAVYVSEKLGDNYMIDFKDVSTNIEYAFSHLAILKDTKRIQ